MQNLVEKPSEEQEQEAAADSTQALLRYEVVHLLIQQLAPVPDLFPLCAFGVTCKAFACGLAEVRQQWECLRLSSGCEGLSSDQLQDPTSVTPFSDGVAMRDSSNFIQLFSRDGELLRSLNTRVRDVDTIDHELLANAVVCHDGAVYIGSWGSRIGLSPGGLLQKWDLATGDLLFSLDFGRVDGADYRTVCSGLAMLAPHSAKCRQAMVAPSSGVCTLFATLTCNRVLVVDPALMELRAIFGHSAKDAECVRLAQLRYQNRGLRSPPPAQPTLEPQPPGAGELNDPCGLAVLDEEPVVTGVQLRLPYPDLNAVQLKLPYPAQIAVADRLHHQIQIFAFPGGRWIRRIGSCGSAPRRFHHPRGLAAAHGLLYVCEETRVQVLTNGGATLQVLPLPGLCWAMCVLPAGEYGSGKAEDRALVLDREAHRVHVLAVDVACAARLATPTAEARGD